MLRAYVQHHQRDWDDHLSVLEFAANNAVQASTGYTPFYLNYGQEVTQPLDHALQQLRPTNNPDADQRIRRLKDDLQRARTNIEAAQKRQAKYVDQRRRDVQLQAGDSVLLSTRHLQLKGDDKRTPKFAQKYIGPFTIRRVINPNAYELDLPATLQLLHSTFNIDRLKPYRDGQQSFPSRPQPHPRPPPVVKLADGSEVYEVEYILAAQGAGQRRRYLVKWKGFGEWEATWEPKDNLSGAKRKIQEFEQRRQE
jgi:hypothetical protein